MTIQYKFQRGNFHPRQIPKTNVLEHYPLALQAGYEGGTLHPTEPAGSCGEPEESIDPHRSDFKMIA